jgi:hypothetical protein
MKKLLLSIGLFSIASLTFAQGTKISVSPRFSNAEKKIKPGSTTKAVTGSLTCNTQYVAGTTMTLDFTLDLTNSDAEYGDSLAVTFPLGMTPTGTANQPDFAPITDNGPGQTTEAYNGINGQTISWGDNDNNYGGIEALGAGISIYNFSIDVAIDQSATGPQTATFHISGDGFGSSPADLDGFVTIYPVGAQQPDLKVLAVGPVNNTSLNRTCSYAQDTVFAVITNIGNTTESNINVNFSLNGGTTVQSLVLVNPNNNNLPTTSIAPGDTLIAIFPIVDFSGAGLKDMKVWVALAGDISNSNDTVVESFYNTIPTNVSTSTYSNGIETDLELNSLFSTWNGLGIGFGPSTSTVHSGTQALFYTINTTIGAPAGEYETYLVLPCMDVVQGETYKISYWRKSNTNANIPNINGSTAIFVGQEEDILSLTDTLKPYSSITPNAQTDPWQKDSVDYTAPATGTIYFAIGAKGTTAGTATASTSGINVRIDDINVTKVQSSSLDENSVVNRVYPNPANDELNFIVNGKISSITINTLDGKVVKTATSSTVDVSALSPGMYIYHVNVDGKIATGNFVKN